MEKTVEGVTYLTKDQAELINWLSVNYEKWLITSALRIVGDIQTAKDVVQEAFWTACLKIDKLSAHPNPAGWMFVAVHNVALREMSRAYRTKESLVEDIDVVGAQGLDLPMEHYFPYGLTEQEREILQLRIEVGFSFEDMAEKLGMRADACRKRFSRALARCRMLMEQENKGKIEK